MLDIAEFTHCAGQNQQNDRLVYEHKPGTERLIAVLCDGLNGSRGGDMAAQICSTASLEALTAGANVETAVVLAGQALQKAQQREQELRTAASTIAVLRLEQGKVTWANLGDSRIYHLSGRDIAHISVDDSPAYADYKRGSLAYEDIRLQKERSHLSAALCASYDPEVNKAHVDEFYLKDGDGLLLCSDGLWSYVFETEIFIEWLKATSAQDWLERLLLRCIQRSLLDGDNVSMLTCLYSSSVKDQETFVREDSKNGK
ncbi:MAG: PP2C family protein-serine/threonine phosphatase [Saccharofermentanales bacterium]|jgi:serine/threonine protein phosphatase PrpC